MSKPVPDRFLSFAEVAELIGLDLHTLKKGRCGTKDIPRIKLGARVLFSLNAVQAWMAAKAREAEEQQRREERAVIDLLSRRRDHKRFMRGTLDAMIQEERRRWK